MCDNMNIVVLSDKYDEKSTSSHKKNFCQPYDILRNRNASCKVLSIVLPIGTTSHDVYIDSHTMAVNGHRRG